MWVAWTWKDGLYKVRDNLRFSPSGSIIVVISCYICQMMLVRGTAKV
jgi:hypothetical protein